MSKDGKKPLGDSSVFQKGRKGAMRVIYGRTAIIAVSFLAQIILIGGVVNFFRPYIPMFFGGYMVLGLGIVLLILNKETTPETKLMWTVITMLLPLVGAALYVYVETQPGYRLLAKRLNDIYKQTEAFVQQDEAVLDALEQKDIGTAQLARYVHKNGNFATYQNTEVTFFPLGEDKFAAMLTELEQAEQFIFMEYFILKEGYMWEKILEILERKVQAGVEVRVMYDGTCAMFDLPFRYPELLKAKGIQCKMFAPIRPILSTHYNNRDHRKILVIDGKVGFTGGVNLADEYINHVEKFGRWKDAAVMLEGEAVRSLTAIFLQMWDIAQEPEFEAYLKQPIPAPAGAKGFAAPYGDCPLDGERVGELVYIDLLNRARKYIHIMTPYLILDGELETALKFAAERGVDVHLILPGKPDKRIPYALAKTHYAALIRSGVKISEWVPGFVHAKVFVVDDREAVVGTINLDYRSLYHHFEDAVWMVDAPCIPAIEDDFQRTLTQCRTVEATKQSIWQGQTLLCLTGRLVKAIAPLL
ncbi:MAG: cardiolipin synthase [Faecalibacterium sp. CAG:82-related_59_9]|nr:MAG: cardiolipin synthase [Faecalibacterium sp. CAG:82-related_59_9]